VKKIEKEAYEEAKLHLALAIRSASRVLEVLEGKRAVVDVKESLPGRKMIARKPPFDEENLSFVDDEAKNVVASAVAARVALGKASVFAKKTRQD